MADEELEGSTPPGGGEPPEEAGERGEAATPAGEEEEAGGEPQPKRGLKKRFAELTEKARTEYYRGRAEALEEVGQRAVKSPPEGPPPVAEVTAAPFTEPRPKEEDFDNFSEYEAAKDDWLIKKAKHEAREEVLAESRKAERQQDDVRWAQRRDDWATKALESIPDFMDVVTVPVNQGGPPFTKEIVDLCMESPIGHQLMYELAQDPAAVRRLASLPPHRLAYEMVKREQRLAAKPPPAKTITGAPPPLRPVGASTTTVTDPGKMSDEDWFRWRGEQRKQTGR